MKRINVLSVLVGLFAVTTMSAQTGVASNSKFGHGQDSIDCRRNLTLYLQDYKNKDYAAAIENWRLVFKNCPHSSVNNVARGISMYQHFIERELDPAKKVALIDTLMQVYRQGMVLRPAKRSEYMAAMAQDMINYYDDKPENQKRIMKVLEDCMIAEKEKTAAIIYVNYMKVIQQMHGKGEMTDEELLENYTRVSGYLNAAVKKASDEELAKASELIDEAFAKSSAASCENLIKIYSTKFNANKGDLEFLSKLTRLLNMKECTDSKLYEQAAEQQYKLDPSAASAFNMATLFYKKKDYGKAIDYMDKAIQQETSKVDKAKYYCQKGALLNEQKQYSEAKKCAQEAIKLRPEWGEPYLLLANTYLAGPKCGEDDFEKSEVYWVVVDKLIIAKTKDPSFAPKVDPSIQSYTRYFPNKEEAFFRNISEGSTVTVGCWIGETTKVRFNK